MVSLSALWLPILLSAVLVFVASSIVHMVLGWHAADWRKFESEDAVLDAIRPFNLSPGDYVAPMPNNMADSNTPEFKARVERGPQVMLTVQRPGGSVGKSLVLWFGYTLVVSVFAGYVAGLALDAGTPYLTVFRVTGTVAFASYGLALWQSWIWYSRSLGYTVRSTVDSLVYALLTAGAFGWLWP